MSMSPTASSIASPTTGRDSQVEDDNSCPDDEDRDSVADAPEDSDQACVPDALLPADDGGYGDNVIWIGGVAHPQDETQCDDGEQGHKQVACNLSRPTRAGMTCFGARSES